MQLTVSLVALLPRLVLASLAWLGGLSALTTAQLERGGGAARPCQSVTGRVCLPDGSPAAGAVVVTSAGGECVAAADGSFVLEVELLLDAESLDVTASAEGAGSGNLVASARIVPASLSRSTSVGKLVLAQTLACQPRWLREFGESPGTDATVDALAVFDDGNGQALYMGGTFTSAGGVAASRIARWDGRWSALGSGVDWSVVALATYDDGGGEALYAGGIFLNAGGVAANRIARWDGTSWSTLGSGCGDTVRAFTVHDDGSGPALHAGGDFTSAGGLAANRIARWDGVSWSALGIGMEAPVHALASWDDGGGSGLFVGL